MCACTHAHDIPRSDPSPGEGFSTNLRCLRTMASCNASSCPSALGGSFLPATLCVVPLPTKQHLPALDSCPRAGWPLSMLPFHGRNSKSQPCSCLGQSHPCRPGLGCCPLPADLAPAPQQPAHPRGIQAPHLGVISRRVATPHSGFLLLLMPLGLFMCCESHRTCLGCSAAQEPSGDCGKSDVGLMQRLS